MRAISAGKPAATVVAPDLREKRVDLRPYVGRYVDPAGRELHVAAVGAALIAVRSGARVSLLPADVADRFYSGVDLWRVAAS